MSEISEIANSDRTMGQLVKSDQSVSAVAVKDDTLGKYLTFTVAGEVFGTNIIYIKEIIEHGRYTRVPLSQSNIRGVINLRGHVVPVVDLAVRLGFDTQPINKRSCIIIVDMEDDGEKIDLGFVVDAVDEVVDVRRSDIEAAPGFGLDIRQDFLEGMGKLKNSQFVKFLDLEATLSIDELSKISTGGQLDG
ncbi:MAG: chemotaxis protein CheW [Thiohalomonadales bacterium]